MDDSSPEFSDSDTSDQYSFSSGDSDSDSVCAPSQDPMEELSGAEMEMEEEESAAHPAKAASSLLSSGGGRQGGRRRGRQKEEEGEGKKEKKTVPGVVYLSRVPPYMKPHKLKHLLSPYGRIGRIFLQPEEDMVRRRRVKFGGSKKRNFTEGWVEFADRRVAKAVAMALNNVPIGGRKRNYYHDDLWNMKYLPKFRWGHLTEKIAYEQAVRQQQMRTEMSQAKRENKHFLASVDKGKAIQAIVQRKKKQGVEVESKSRRHFVQRRVNRSPSPSDDEGTSSITPTCRLSDTLLKKILPG